MPKKSRSKWTALCRAAEHARRQHDVPGVVVGVLHKGRVRAAGFGVTNLEHPLDVTAGTLFQIGSITKTYSATLAMKMVESGQLNLDASIRRYLPGFRVRDPEASEKATLRHLLTHTSGWFGDFFLDTGPGDDAGERYVARMADLEQVAPFGQMFSYNNAGFYLLGRLIEVVSGRTFQAALKENLLDPLEMENTFFDAGDVITHRFASGHYGRQVARPWPLPRAAHPAGGITCSVHDLLAYARFQMGDGSLPGGGRLLRPETLDLMQTPQVPVWQQESRGLSWLVDESHGVRMVSHGGGTTGQISQLTLVPEKQLAIAVFTNAGAGGQVTLEVTRAALREYLSLDIHDPETLEVTEKELSAYTGLYRQPMADLELAVLAGRLVGQRVARMGFPVLDMPPAPPPPPMSLGLIEPDRLVVLDGLMKSARIDVLRRADGSIGWLRMGGRLHPKA